MWRAGIQQHRNIWLQVYRTTHICVKFRNAVLSYLQNVGHCPRHYYEPRTTRCRYISLRVFYSGYKTTQTIAHCNLPVLVKFINITGGKTALGISKSSKKLVKAHCRTNLFKQSHMSKLAIVCLYLKQIKRSKQNKQQSIMMMTIIVKNLQ